MSDPFDPLDPSDALDPEDLLEEEISAMDRPQGAEDRTTASELRELRSIDDETRREVPESRGPGRGDAEVLIDHDAPDVEGQLIADATDSEEGPRSAEEASMREADGAPGATNDENDGYED